ncbi:hypothetical protein [Alkalinema sp. FACHB-956]|uniref:hypothetical protein n=1 Tax=Alkalinema sp. FACHB-956 TaxID=2692768 RepID=UPI0016872701|nr:hypothetical protein [Alkalinema sp. FACHB-956]MBD2328701.1 hypothetical protein [Alkalinema sp. FACHB-956]
MKRWIGTTVLTAATFVAILSQLIPANPTQASANGDQRVKAALDKMGWKYEIDQDGDFKVVLKMKDERTQRAFIRSKTDSLKGLEVRQIVSPGYVAQGELSADVANQLLKASNKTKVGAWQVVQGEKRSVALFAAKVDANLKPEDLEVALMVTLYSADAMEKQLTGKDDF